MTITIHIDVPSPRCTKIGPAQGLRVVNRTSEQVRVTLAGFDVTVPAGGLHVLETAVGSYLAPGVHIMHASSPVVGVGLWLAGAIAR